MTRRALVLRPEPGAAATLERLAAAGVVGEAMPLFRVLPRAWSPPAGAFDALLLTSANAVRHGGEGLARVRHLPVVDRGRLIGIVSIRDLYQCVVDQMGADIILLAEGLLQG